MNEIKINECVKADPYEYRSSILLDLDFNDKGTVYTLIIEGHCNVKTVAFERETINLPESSETKLACDYTDKLYIDGEEIENNLVDAKQIEKLVEDYCLQ